MLCFVPSACVSMSNDRSIARQPIKSNYSKKPSSAFDIGLMSFHPRPYPAPALEIQLRGSCEIEFRVNECTLTRPEHAYANIRLLRSGTF